jgi:DNA-binding transcriptional regulator YiaG
MEQISQEDAASILGVTVFTLQKWRSLKKGPSYYKPAREVIYLKEDILQYLKESKKEFKK